MLSSNRSERLPTGQSRAQLNIIEHSTFRKEAPSILGGRKSEPPYVGGYVSGFKARMFRGILSSLRREGSQSWYHDTSQYQPAIPPTSFGSYESSLP